MNKILVEMGALLVILGIPTSHRVGLDRILHMRRGAAATAELATEEAR